MTYSFRADSEHFCLFFNDLLMIVSFCFNKNHKTSSTMLFCSICSPPWQGASATPGMGMAGVTNTCSIHHPIYGFYRFLKNSLMNFLLIFHRIIQKIIKHVCFLNLFASGQGTFATPGMGGAGGKQGPIFVHHPI